MLKRYKKIKIPAEYGTVERQVKLDDGSVIFEKERVLLRHATEEYKNVRHLLRYETRSENVFVPEREYKRLDGTIQTFPSSYKTVTKRVLVGYDTQPPFAAAKLIKFFAKRDVRKGILAELQSDYQEEQIPEFGLFGADVWYWKEVIFFLLSNAVGSDLGKAIGRYLPKPEE